MEKKNTLNELENKMDQLGRELNALAYAMALVEEKHKNAADMVEHVPTNIYIEDWKREERHTARKLEALKGLYEKVGKEQAKICQKIDAYYDR